MEELDLSQYRRKKPDEMDLEEYRVIPKNYGGQVVEPTDKITARVQPKREVNVDSLKALLTGIGQSASAGLTQYPAAAGIMATRALTGGAPVSYPEALAMVREENRALQEQNPVAYTLGQLTGGVGAGGALSRARSLTTLPGMVGTGTVLGGVSGYTQDENLRDAALGAALGGATSAGVGAAFQGGKLLTDKIAREVAARDLEKLLKSKQAGNREALENILGITDKEFRAQGTTVFKEARNFVDMLRSNEETFKAFAETTKPLSELYRRTPQQHMMNIGRAGIFGGAGAGVGAGLEALSGGIIPPGLAMAGLGLYGAKSAAGEAAVDIGKQMVSRAALSKSPIVEQVYTLRDMVPNRAAMMPPYVRATPSPAGTAIIGATVPTMASTVAQPQPQMPMISPEEQAMQPEPMARTSRLQQLADQFRARLGM